MSHPEQFLYLGNQKACRRLTEAEGNPLTANCDEALSDRYEGLNYAWDLNVRPRKSRMSEADQRCSGLVERSRT